MCNNVFSCNWVLGHLTLQRSSNKSLVQFEKHMPPTLYITHDNYPQMYTTNDDK
jgi:hypothetical protein